MTKDAESSRNGNRASQGGAAAENEIKNGSEKAAAEESQNPSAEAGTAFIDAAQLESLKKQAAERDEYLDLAKRTQAEFQNYQKRVQREREQERQYHAAALVRDLLPVLDNLERALYAAKSAGDSGALVQGVTMVQTQFLELLKRQGVTPIPAEGQPFDPNLHEALTQQPSTELPPNTVMHVHETGYMMHDRVLRPAKVVVSSPAVEG